MLLRVLVYVYVLSLGISLLLSHPAPLAIAP